MLSDRDPFTATRNLKHKSRPLYWIHLNLQVVKYIKRADRPDEWRHEASKFMQTAEIHWRQPMF